MNVACWPTDSIERSACNAETTGSSLAQDMQLLCRDQKKAIYSQFPSNTDVLHRVIHYYVRKAESRLDIITLIKRL